MRRSPFFILVLLVALASLQPKLCLAQDEPAAGGARKVLNRIVPMYPQMARSMSLRGAVKLEVLVQPNGNVKSVEVRGGNPLLVQSAQTAVHGWKWEKADHESVEQVEFRFSP